MRQGRVRSGRPTSSVREEPSSGVGLLRDFFGRGGDGRFLRHSDGQRKQVDETFGVLGVVPRHGEAREIGAIERIWRGARGEGRLTMPLQSAKETEPVTRRWALVKNASSASRSGVNHMP